MPGPYVGKDAKLYYNSATNASPTWVLITRAIDVSADISQTAVDVSSRTSKYKAHLPGLVEYSVSFGYRVPTGADTVFDVFLTMTATQTVKQFAVMDAAIATTLSQGPKLYCMLEALNLAQAMEEGGVVEFSLKPAYFEEGAVQIDPSWFEVP